MSGKIKRDQVIYIPIIWHYAHVNVNKNVRKDGLTELPSYQLYQNVFLFDIYENCKTLMTLQELHQQSMCQKLYILLKFSLMCPNTSMYKYLFI